LSLTCIVFSARFEQSCLEDLQEKDPEIKALIDGATDHSPEFVSCDPKLPLGMSNEIIQGYTDRDENGVYHPKNARCHSLKIYAVE
jgi:hypothetical protein|tara:strand:- start:176 stop:433 length:258 start_codon:yes stop_codon:yes gene_type:complete